MNMDNFNAISLVDLASLPTFDFLNNLTTNESDFDFTDSPYDVNTFNCLYKDEYDFHATYNSCKNLSMMSLNIQSLNAKYADFLLMINLLNSNNCSPDIICLQEVWQIPDSVDFSLPGYHPLVFTQRRSTHGGGVGIFVKNFFKFSVLHQKSVFIERVYESIVIELELSNNSKIIFGSVYRPGSHHPRFNANELFDQFLDLFSNQLNDLISTNKTLYLLGDMNLDLLKYNECAQVTTYVDLLFSFGLLETVTRPTRYTVRSATLIDHVITNFHSNSYETVILTSNLSDHFPVIHFKKEIVNCSAPNTVEFRNFSSTNLEAFGTALRGTSWDHVLECEDSQTSYNRFHDTFFNLYDFFFPVKIVKFNRNKHKIEQWITNGLLISRKNKIKLYKTSINRPSAENISRFKNYRNVYNTTIRAAKKLYFEKTFKKFQSNLKKSWEILFNAVNKKRHSKERIDQIFSDGVLITDPKLMADKFNIFFTSVASQIAETIIPTDRPPDVGVVPVPDDSLFSFSRDPVTLTDVSDAIRSLEPKKTLDCNNLSVWFISNFALTLSRPLHHVISTSFLTGIIPVQLKIAKVVPIFKSGNKEDTNNYRPISLLNVFSKILEKIVGNRLSSFLESNKILSDSQFGFRKSHSTVHPLTKLLNFVAQANNSKEHVIAIFCDLRKAFDTCDHNILLDKLYKIGIRGIELSWFRNYLTGRKQFVFINGVSSNLLDILIGVPQGSILGPLLFLVYINDLPLCSKLLSLLFADDAALVAKHKNLDTLVEIVNAEFKKVTHFFRFNRLSLHHDKTKFMLMSYSPEVARSNVNIYIDNNDNPNNQLPIYPLSQVNESSDIPAIKYLGVFIDPKLNFRYHVNQISTKLSKAFFFLRKSKHFLTLSALKSLYYSLIHCHITYALPVWSSTSANIIKPIITKQKIAIRLITNSPFNSHTEPLFKNLNILPLQDLILMSKLQFMQLYIHNNLPSLFVGEWLTLEERRHDPDQAVLRNQDNLYVPFARTIFSENMPWTSFPRTWNEFVCNEIKFIPNKLEFKIKLKAHLISKLSSVVTCNRLLCPRCHLAQQL
jgi:Reverse transcriptase (RNA-dependent DNA polymerase)/Endonuclease/Exonuclease/phosphatase family